MKNDHIDDSDALSHLDALDQIHGVNNIKAVIEPAEEEESPKKITSLGKASSFQETQLSGAEDSPWKHLRLDLLPSLGMFYPERIELLIRSATTREIRHWSTMDEYDPISVEEKINFILNACTRFKIPGNSFQFTFNDFLLVDRYHILFKIYELTFPNQENKLMANIKCNNESCGHTNRIQILSKNLRGFEIPEDYLKWYNDTERCFVVPSDKLQEVLRFYLPTIGSNSKLRQRSDFEKKSGVPRDDSFYEVSPYLIGNWRAADNSSVADLKRQIDAWTTQKFSAVNRFATDMKAASINQALGTCEKCKEQMESHIFLGGSFTVKDIFIISAGFDELI